jgi:hypothetical protein
MNSPKPVICPERLRTLPPRFSWIDQRLVQAHHLDRIDVCAAALYLFLVTVANGQGLSWYGDDTLARRLSLTPGRVRQARAALVTVGLLAFADGVYQVLALDGMEQQSGMSPAGASATTMVLAEPPGDRATAQHHLAIMYAALERCP